MVLFWCLFIAKNTTDVRAFRLPSVSFDIPPPALVTSLYLAIFVAPFIIFLLVGLQSHFSLTYPFIRSYNVCTQVVLFSYLLLQTLPNLTTPLLLPLLPKTEL